MTKPVLFALVVLVLAAAGGGYYWYNFAGGAAIVTGEAEQPQLTEITRPDPAAMIVSDDEYVLVIELAGSVSGTVEIELFNDIAPLHTERLRELAKSGAYDGIAFHRVIDGFMAQTGDVKFANFAEYDIRLAGRGGSDLPNLPIEVSDEQFVEGIVGMARSADPNSANSQFFIMFGPQSSLNGQYTVIGRVVSGMEFVHQIKRGDAQNNGMVFDAPDYMASVRVKADL